MTVNTLVLNLSKIFSVTLAQYVVVPNKIDHVMAEAIYDTGVRAQYGDNLLTLSTCSYHTDNGRFVVVARKV